MKLRLISVDPADKETLDDRVEAPFDVWAKRWVPETDKFEWRRFVNCRFDWANNHPERKERGRILIGVSDEWRPVYWVPIITPAEAA